MQVNLNEDEFRWILTALTKFRKDDVEGMQDKIWLLDELIDRLAFLLENFEAEG